MKKVIAAFLSAMSVLAALSVPSSAAEPDNMRIFVNYRETVDEIYFDVTVRTDSPCAGIQGILAADVGFELQKTIINESIAGYNDVGSSAFQTNDGIRFILVGDVENGTNGSWITFTLRLYNKKPGGVTFTVLMPAVSSLKGRTSEPRVINAYTKLYLLKGDINRDDRVDITDLIRLKKYFSGLITQEQYSVFNSDCNSDKMIDSADMARLRGILLGIK